MHKRYSAIGILGGTFDPVHNGHIQLAQIILKQFHLKEIRFIPCYQPVHRPTPFASPEQRAHILNLALSQEKNMVLDKREIEQQGPSYMIDTLKSLRQEFPDTALCLIMGIDSFVHLSSWHQWQSLLDYAHFIVVNRPNVDSKIPGEITKLLKKHGTTNPENLNYFLSGKIVQLKIPPIEISGTAIREQLQKCGKPQEELPIDVLNYILEKQIYLK